MKPYFPSKSGQDRTSGLAAKNLQSFDFGATWRRPYLTYDVMMMS
jgi:hypothetical protein